MGGSGNPDFYHYYFIYFPLSLITISFIKNIILSILFIHLSLSCSRVQTARALAVLLTKWSAQVTQDSSLHYECFLSTKLVTPLWVAVRCLQIRKHSNDMFVVVCILFNVLFVHRVLCRTRAYTLNASLAYTDSKQRRRLWQTAAVCGPRSGATDGQTAGTGATRPAVSSSLSSPGNSLCTSVRPLRRWSSVPGAVPLFQTKHI